MNTTHLCNRCLITEVYKVDHEFKLALRELLPVSASSPRKWDLTSLSPPLPQPSTCKYRTKTTFVLTGSKFEYLGMRRQDTASTHSLIIGKQRTTQAQSTALQVLFRSPQYWDLARCGKFQSPTNHLWSMWLTASTKVCSNTSVTLYSFNIFLKYNSQWTLVSIALHEESWLGTTLPAQWAQRAPGTATGRKSRPAKRI